MSLLLEGKSALVTGGASGIGRASAFAFAREGARVMVTDIDEAPGQQVAAEIRAGGGDARFSVVDVGREDAVEAMVRETVEVFGRLDCALNNAGMTGPMGPLQSVALDDFERVIGLNLTGVFLCMKHEIPVMAAGAAIVNMASGSGMIPTPGLAPYCASKHGVLGLTRTAAVENARAGIRINAICPGSIDTPMLQSAMAIDPQVKKMILAGQPGGRLGTPEEIAEAVVWLCSERASFVTGHSMLVDGGALAR